MKKYVLLFLAFISIFSYSHPPKKIFVEYSLEEYRVDINIMHSTKDRKVHYIKSVKIFLNGETKIFQTFTIQTSNHNNKISYVIPELKKGDKLKVEVYCNIYGKKVLEKELEK